MTPHRRALAAALAAVLGAPLLAQRQEPPPTPTSSGGFGFRAELPLDGIAPGLYVIHVEARANTGDRPVVSRDVAIKIQ